jgi:hypothetical protein
MTATIATRHRFGATALIRENELIEGHEKSFLAHLMSGRTACDEFFHRVSVDVLTVPHHRAILAAIRDVYDERDEINHVTVSNRLSEKGKLAECGSIPGVIEIALSTTSAEIAESALNCILEAYRGREAAKIAKQFVAGEISLEQAAKGLTEWSADASEAYRPLIEFRSPLQLRNFTPPPGIDLVGDCHIVQGNVTVIGGPPGVGKSRGSVSLAVAGASCGEWFGLTVHRRFKTMIIQTENGLFRLSKEFAELDCEGLEDCVRICPPPPFGLCLEREDFRAHLLAAIQAFGPDVIILDPWNAAARDEKAREYLGTFELIRSLLPAGDDSPAIVIVAHTRKPRPDERATGRSLLNLLAGSYVLGSVPRTVFVMQAASDDTEDNRIVWTCCKNNDGELGARSAWERRNGLFAPVHEFDWEGFDSPHKDNRVTITADDLAEIFGDGEKEITRADAVKALQTLTGAGRTACYDALRLDGRCAKQLQESHGLLSWKA